MIYWAKFEGKLFFDPECTGPLLQTLPLNNGKPTFASPASTLFLTLSDNSRHFPQKGKLPTRQQTSQKMKVSVQSHQDSSVQCCIINPLSAGSITCAQTTRERDVRFLTGMQSTAAFKLFFEPFYEKASVMHYWKGGKDPTRDT